MTKQLIVNADDFGYTAGVTRGILRAHQQGIVTSATVMVNYPGAEQSIETALREAPSLGLGLHLNLTDGYPISAPSLIPDLVDDQGHFLTKEALRPNLVAIDEAQIALELQAQVQRFITLAGRNPDHLDSHHHAVYMSPNTMRVTCRIAHELNIPIRRAVPTNQDMASAQLVQYGLTQDLAKAHELVDEIDSILSNNNMRMPDFFIVDFYAEKATLGDFLNMLLDLHDGVTEIMCHPAEVDSELIEISSYASERATELEAVTHASILEVIRSEGIELVTFEALASE